MRYLTFALIAGVVVAAPVAVRAASITEPFSLTIPTTTLMGGDVANDFFTTSFPEFNPSNGTLNDVTVMLAGSATWTTSASSPLLHLQLLTATDGSLTGTDNFFSPGTISLNFLDQNDTSVGDLFTGTGTTTVLLVASTLDTGDTLATNGSLTGSITYDFTPTAPAVPEPASLALLGTALAGLGFLRRRKGK